MRLLPVILLSTLTAARGLAQDTSGIYYPLDEASPPGVNAHWSVVGKPTMHGYPQPVRVSVPTTGTVTFYSPAAPTGQSVEAPAQARMGVGHIYRVKIADMPEYPGIELYPSIEVLDRLHPPADQIEQFPIPVEITAEEIDAVLQDRMVNKVVYMERQDLPRPSVLLEERRITDLENGVNLVEAADTLGRPVAIVRLGGRTPVANAYDELLPVPTAVALPVVPRVP